MFGLVILFGLIMFFIVPPVVLAIALIFRHPEKPSIYGDIPPPQTLISAWCTVFRKSMDFSGRASRSEFWWFFLIYAIFAILTIFMFHLFVQPNARQFLWLYWLPVIGVGTRRLHDIGRSGIWQIFILWGTGFLGLLVLWALPTKHDM